MINEGKNDTIDESEYDKMNRTWEKYETNLWFTYNDIISFMVDYSRIKTKYDVNMLIPNVDFGDGLDIIYIIEGVGYSKVKK